MAHLHHTLEPGRAVESELQPPQRGGGAAGPGQGEGTAFTPLTSVPPRRQPAQSLSSATPSSPGTQLLTPHWHPAAPPGTADPPHHTTPPPGYK
ncbi:hypothetical protein CgunFtcFv8_003536 [Champsocephalus gunnari]|uniref:Uncharacterized protein n=1 Tax=Champsocephalus gunnari TaxID=52237 RepID=A0AAN8DYQ0_CHAGU|nr:hypothetical protein CgunFtcFv8_003536 [Champsocephalus gunnari]